MVERNQQGLIISTACLKVKCGSRLILDCELGYSNSVGLHWFDLVGELSAAS